MLSLRRNKKMTELTKEELEETLKDLLLYLELDEKEKDEKHIPLKKYDPTGWAWNIKEMLRHRMGHDHADFSGFDFVSSLGVWLILEIWSDGRIIPRCVSLTEHDAEKAKNLLEYAYENSKKEDRPRISIEHQRTEHLFGFEMQFGRLEKFEGLYPRRQFVKGGK
jgi:hypothetical protein